MRLVNALSALCASVILSSCGHLAGSERCGAPVATPSSACTSAASNSTAALQVYALPITVVDFAFSKPSSGVWTLAATPHNVPDPDAHAWYRISYTRNAGADDHVIFTVRNGLLNASDTMGAPELPDIAGLVGPLTTAIGAPIRLAETLHAAGETGGRHHESYTREGIISSALSNTIEARPFATSISCSAEDLLQATANSNTCRVQVANRVQIIELSCTGAPDLATLRRLFGTAVNVTTACSANKPDGALIFEAPYSRLFITMWSDDCNFNPTPGSSDAHCPAAAVPTPLWGPRPTTTPACGDGCPPTNQDALFYRILLPLLVTATPCEQRANFTDQTGVDAVVAYASSCTSVSAGNLEFTGATQRIMVVSRQSTQHVDMPRSIGTDHRKYTFTDGVLETADIQRTGILLGIIRLPLTVLGIGTGSKSGN